MDALGDYDNMWEGQNIRYRGDNTRTKNWNIRAMDKDLVIHV